jgi:phosphoribosylformylglycinamidine cyclo-ligase
MAWDAPAPFDKTRSLGEAALMPTRIYVKSHLAAIRETGAVKALAHLTGGGFPDNIPRVLPQGLGARVDLTKIPLPPIFHWLASAGGIAQDEMLRTFNCGIGMVAVVERDKAADVAAVLTREGERVVTLGEVVASAGGAPRVVYSGSLTL